VARNVAVAPSRESGAQHLAAWFQPADGDHKSPLAANGDLKFARRAAILTISSTKRHRVDSSCANVEPARGKSAGVRTRLGLRECKPCRDGVDGTLSAFRLIGVQYWQSQHRWGFDPLACASCL
jgi:hypothetical protein